MDHTDELLCPGCLIQLVGVERALWRWFKKMRARYINAHIYAAYPSALELFQIDEDGVSRYNGPFYKKVDSENKAARLSVGFNGKNRFHWKQ